LGGFVRLSTPDEAGERKQSRGARARRMLSSHTVRESAVSLFTGIDGHHALSDALSLLLDVEYSHDAGGVSGHWAALSGWSTPDEAGRAKAKPRRPRQADAVIRPEARWTVAAWRGGHGHGRTMLRTSHGPAPFERHR